MSINKSKNKNERKRINNDMALTWRNWSIVTINATFQFLDICRCRCRWWLSLFYFLFILKKAPQIVIYK